MEETQAAWPQLWGVSPFSTLNIKLEYGSCRGSACGKLGMSDSKHYSCCFGLVSQDSGRFKSGFCEATGCSREVGCPGNAQTQSLGKVGVDVNHGWGLGHRSCDTFCCSQTSCTVWKTTKIPAWQFPASPLTSQALLMHVSDYLRHQHKFSIFVLKNIFPLGSWYTWKCQNGHSCPTSCANERRWNILIPELTQQVTRHVK